MIIKLSILATVCVAIVSCHRDPNLKFIVSARNLLNRDDIGTSDPYYEVSYSNDGGLTKVKIGRSDAIQDQENPDWVNTFHIKFDRSSDQYLYFHVYDEDDVKEDDTLGRVWINVADYVDKGQFVNANLDKAGYLTVKSTNPNVENSRSGIQLGELPLPEGTPDNEKLKFKLSANNLLSKDNLAFLSLKSDPYVVVYATDGLTGREKEVGKTSHASSVNDPTWDDKLTFHWHRNDDQRWHFKIYDRNLLIRDDDKLGQGWMQVNDYMAHGQSYTLLLARGGTLTITRD